jgi:hypothetical protein
VFPSKDWNDLKRMLSTHRFYVHTAHPDLEDGYNMASLEAMAAGLPIVGNRHPTSPVEHGVSGFLSDDPGELRQYALILLQNRDLARQMGEEARKVAAERFSMDRFAARFTRSIEIAKERWQRRKVSEAYFSEDLVGEEGRLSLLARDGRFARLSEQFQDQAKAKDMAAALEALKEMMILLGMDKERTLSTLEGFVKGVETVSKRLMTLQDSRSAERLLKAGLALISDKTSWM